MSTEVAKAPPRMEDFLPEGLPALEESVEREVAEAQARADAIQVSSEAEARVALEASKEINRRVKAIEAERVSLTKPRKDAAEEIKRRYDQLKAPFEAADKRIREKLGGFAEEQERKRREEQERLERERQEREAAARRERERQEREAAERRRKAEEEARVARALAEEEATEEAESLAAEEEAKARQAAVAESAIKGLPEPAMPARVAPAPAKLDGFSRPKRWVAEVVDFDALPNRLPDGTPLKVVDEAALRRWMLAEVKANGDVAPSLPGARFEKKATTAVRA